MGEYVCIGDVVMGSFESAFYANPIETKTKTKRIRHASLVRHRVIGNVDSLIGKDSGSVVAK